MGRAYGGEGVEVGESGSELGQVYTLSSLNPPQNLPGTAALQNFPALSALSIGVKGAGKDISSSSWRVGTVVVSCIMAFWDMRTFLCTTGDKNG